MLCGAAGSKVRGQTAGDCGGSHVHIPKYHWGVELVPRVLVDDVSSLPVVWGVLICGKISDLHEKKYRLSNLNMHLAQFLQIVGITKERCSAKKVMMINILEQFQ